MKYELQQERSSQKKTKVDNKTISEQLTKANDKNKILELQIMKYDNNESLIISEQKKEIKDLENRLEKSLKINAKKSVKNNSSATDQQTQIQPAQADAAISVNLPLISDESIAENASTVDKFLNHEDKMIVLNKMRDKARAYAMKEGSLEKEYFTFNTVMVVNDILEKSVTDTVGENIRGTAANKCRLGKSFHNLTKAEKSFLRPDLA